MDEACFNVEDCEFKKLSLMNKDILHLYLVRNDIHIALNQMGPSILVYCPVYSSLIMAGSKYYKRLIDHYIPSVYTVTR